MNDYLNSKSTIMKRLLQLRQFPKKNFTVSVLFTLIALLSGFNGWGQIVTGFSSSPTVTSSGNVTVTILNGSAITQTPVYNSSHGGLDFGTVAATSPGGIKAIVPVQQPLTQNH